MPMCNLQIRGKYYLSKKKKIRIKYQNWKINAPEQSTKRLGLGIPAPEVEDRMWELPLEFELRSKTHRFSLERIYQNAPYCLCHMC